jgi:hypothetical protein
VIVIQPFKSGALLRASWLFASHLMRLAKAGVPRTAARIADATLCYKNQQHVCPA